MHVYIYVFMCMLFVCMYVCSVWCFVLYCMYICTYVHIYIHMYVCVYHLPDLKNNVCMYVVQDVLAVSDGYSVGIWSATSGAKIMEVSNKHSHPNRISGTLAGKVASSSSGTSSGTTNLGEVYTPLAAPRITAMKWINEVELAPLYLFDY